MTTMNPRQRREYFRARQRRKKAAGICVRCKNPARLGRTMCLKHLLYLSKANQKRRRP